MTTSSFWKLIPGSIVIGNNKFLIAETIASELPRPQPLYSGWRLTDVNNIATFCQNIPSRYVTLVKICGLAQHLPRGSAPWLPFLNGGSTLGERFAKS
jgi:hypothetical protein